MCTGPVEVGENAASNEVQLLYVKTVSCSPSLAKQAKTGFLPADGVKVVDRRESSPQPLIRSESAH